MSDTAVEFPLSVLNRLLIYHFSDLIGDTEKQIKSLQRDLRLFKAFLNATVKKRRKDEHAKSDDAQFLGIKIHDVGYEFDNAQLLAIKIHDVAYELDDALDVFYSKLIDIEEQQQPMSLNLNRICRKVNGVRDEVERYWLIHGSTNAQVDYGKSEVQLLRRGGVQIVRQKGVVGFEDVTEELIRRLTTETDYFDVVSLTGMYGLGKTTLAWKIFNHPEIINNFPVRKWLQISDEFSLKNVFLSILKYFTTINEDILRKDSLEIARMVYTCLQRARFLIVMDDVWSSTDWNTLRIAIPKSNKKGKILITSRDYEVGNYASNPRPPVKLRFFTHNECWELLRLEVFGQLYCPPELEMVGKSISIGCEELPLSIVAIGSILAAKFPPSNMTNMKKAWEKVYERLRTHINENDRHIELFRMSYEKLPIHLRSCLLYFGMFREQDPISVSKLICMWIGEGFIQPKADRSLEETAHMYLEELINRNMVRICKFKADGKVKICQIHGITREFCRIQAADENFSHEIKDVTTSNMSKFRRVCVHVEWFSLISSKSLGPFVRSFVSLSDNQCGLMGFESSNIIEPFKILRVFDVSSFKFTNNNSYLHNMIHMRYIAFCCDWSNLPSAFNKLWHIQTLIVRTTSPTLEVEADIWKMRHLRHFKTNATASLPKPSPGSKHGVELQTLGTISAESFTAELCERAPNLKKLGIRGRLALLLERKIGSIDSLGKMEHLRKLKLINDVHPEPQSEGRLHRLPLCDQFPSGLTSLTLCYTYLSWDHMYTLTLLKELEVLKLKDYAFVGDTWEIQCGGFQSLEYLHIERTDLAFLRASPLSYPKLTTLVLRNCDNLCEIPVELADIPSFRMLDLFFCESAVESARKILDAKKKTPAEGPEFEFSIIPLME